MLCAGVAALVAACGGGSSTDSVQGEILANKPTATTTTATAATTASVATPTTTPITTPTTTPTAIPTTANNYYVATTGSDSNAGTQSSPFKTILKASQVAVPNSTVHVAAGTYTGGFQTTKSGTATGRIYYVSDTKWAAKIVGGSSEMGWDNRGDYVDIVGFDVDGTGSAAMLNGIYIGGSYNAVRNNHVHHIATTVACTSHGGAGIHTDHYYNGVADDVTGNVVNNIGPAGCSYIHGLYISTSGNVKNNLVYNIAWAGIHLWHDATNITISNNTVFGSVYGAIVGGGGYYHLSSVDNVHVSNNIIYDNTYGIMETGATGTHNTYTNNLVYKNSSYNWSLQNGLTATGTVAAEPQFVNYVRTGGGDYRLTPASPAIDKGALADAPAIDIDGALRPQGAGPDIGAYEY